MPRKYDPVPSLRAEGRRHLQAARWWSLAPGVHPHTVARRMRLARHYYQAAARAVLVAREWTQGKTVEAVG